MRSITLLAALLLSPGWIVVAQSARDEAALEQEIRRLEQMEVDAVLRMDLTTLEGLWSPSFIVNNPQNGISADRSVVFDRIKRGLISYSDYQRRIEAIRFDGDIAIVMGSETVVPKGGTGSSVEPLHRRYTTIWKKSGTRWLAIARHANVVREADAGAR
jgi:ketosteroid isomerase-like protein